MGAPYMSQNQSDISREYLSKKRVPQLLQRLSAAVLFHRPDDPRSFLLKQLEALKSGEDMLFTDDDLRTMFDMFDIVRKGSITVSQYKQAMSTLGVEAAAEPATAIVSFDEFSKLAKEGLRDSAQSYIDGR